MPRARVLIFGWSDRVHIQRWAKGLAERNYDIKVVSQGGQPIENIDTICLPRGGKLTYISNTMAAIRHAREFKPDIVHVHYAGGFGLWGVNTKLKPLVVSVWGSDIVDLPQKWYYRRLIKRTLKAATTITATGQFLKTTTVDLFPEAKPKTEIIPFGVNVPDTVEPAPPANPIKICFITAHEPIYGPEPLLRALAIVKRTIADFVLNMAGQGSITAHLRTRAKDLGIADNVDFVGFVENHKMPAFIGQHHMMVMPSLKEAFGVAVLEASACGRPVIASDVGGVPEVLVDGETGILVPKGDVDKLAEAIIRLAKDADLREKMGAAGRAFVRENYTWDKSLDMMEELYERLLHEQK